jgi:protocatechuate 3,4-dioxygenase beta subunit
MPDAADGRHLERHGTGFGIVVPGGSGKTDAREASMDDDARRWTRRGVLGLGVAVPLSVRLGFAAGLAVLPLTPECADADEAPTPPSIEGPYFKPRSPERRVLREPGIPGTPLVVTGRVLSVGGVAVAKALVDVWQADASGAYDLRGYRMRGHQFTDEKGVYRVETVVPGNYPGRTRHLHVKVQAPRRPVLTTQLYFPDDPRNRADGLFRNDLVMKIAESSTGRTGTFDFVVRTA